MSVGERQNLGSAQTFLVNSGDASSNKISDLRNVCGAIMPWIQRLNGAVQDGAGSSVLFVIKNKDEIAKISPRIFELFEELARRQALTDVPDAERYLPSAEAHELVTLLDGLPGIERGKYSSPDNDGLREVAQTLSRGETKKSIGFMDAFKSLLNSEPDQAVFEKLSADTGVEVEKLKEAHAASSEIEDTPGKAYAMLEAIGADGDIEIKIPRILVDAIALYTKDRLESTDYQSFKTAHEVDASTLRVQRGIIQSAHKNKSPTYKALSLLTELNTRGDNLDQAASRMLDELKSISQPVTPQVTEDPGKTGVMNEVGATGEFDNDSYQPTVSIPTNYSNTPLRMDWYVDGIYVPVDPQEDALPDPMLARVDYSQNEALSGIGTKGHFISTVEDILSFEMNSLDFRDYLLAEDNGETRLKTLSRKLGKLKAIESKFTSRFRELPDINDDETESSVFDDLSKQKTPIPLDELLKMKLAASSLTGLDWVSHKAFNLSEQEERVLNGIYLNLYREGFDQTGSSDTDSNILKREGNFILLTLYESLNDRFQTRFKDYVKGVSLNSLSETSTATYLKLLHPEGSDPINKEELDAFNKDLSNLTGKGDIIPRAEFNAELYDPLYQLGLMKDFVKTLGDEAQRNVRRIIDTEVGEFINLDSNTDAVDRLQAALIDTDPGAFETCAERELSNILNKLREQANDTVILPQLKLGVKKAIEEKNLAANTKIVRRVLEAIFQGNAEPRDSLIDLSLQTTEGGQFLITDEQFRDLLAKHTGNQDPSDSLLGEFRGEFLRTLDNEIDRAEQIQRARETARGQAESTKNLSADEIANEVTARLTETLGKQRRRSPTLPWLLTSGGLVAAGTLASMIALNNREPVETPELAPGTFPQGTEIVEKSDQREIPLITKSSTSKSGRSPLASELHLKIESSNPPVFCPAPLRSDGKGLGELTTISYQMPSGTSKTLQMPKDLLDAFKIDDEQEKNNFAQWFYRAILENEVFRQGLNRDLILTAISNAARQGRLIIKTEKTATNVNYDSENNTLVFPEEGTRSLRKPDKDWIAHHNLLKDQTAKIVIETFSPTSGSLRLFNETSTSNTK